MLARFVFQNVWIKKSHILKGLVTAVVTATAGAIGFSINAEAGYLGTISMFGINAVFYDRADWYVRPKSEGLKESVEALVSYLKSIFQRNQINIVDTGSQETPGTPDAARPMTKLVWESPEDPET